MADRGRRDSTEEGFCPLGNCDGSGWLLGEQNVASECGCRQTRVNKARTRNMGTGIPRRFMHDASFDRNPVRDMNPVIRRDAQRFCREIDANLDAGRGRWFFGDIGTGKTLLAMLISKAAVEAGRSVAVYSTPRLLAEIKETYDTDSERSYMDLFNRLRSVDLLHLDDLGAEKRTEWVLQELYSIVNERWQDQRSMVVTTNLDLDDLREQIGARTVSRLMEICGEPIPLMGGDLRMTYKPPEDDSAAA